MISGTVTGSAQVLKRLDNFTPSVRSELVREMKSIAIDLQRHVKENKLSGQVLKNRTGTLRRSIGQRVIVDEESITAIVGTSLVYGPFWEYGFHGIESVRAHMRTIREAFGRKIDPVTFAVSPHTRRVNQDARSYLRSALADKRVEIDRRLRDAVERAKL